MIAADEWQANGMREDGWQRIPQSAPIAQGIEQPGSPRVASRRRLAARPRDQSPWPVRFVSMARHRSVEITVVIVLDHGLRAGTC